MKTGNYIYRQGVAPETRVAVSQKNKIFTKHEGLTEGGFVQVGVLSTFDLSESRGVEPVRGVGYGDQVAELVPGVTEPMALTLNRMLLYLSNIFQVLGYKAGGSGLVRSLKHHQWPFDIKQELVMSQLSSNDAEGLGNGFNYKNSSDAPDTFKALFTFYEACWINSYDTSFPADAAQVTENCSVTVTDVIDGTSSYNSVVLDSGNNPFVTTDKTGSFRFEGSGSAAPTVPGLG
jgi:hypothetical protein